MLLDRPSPRNRPPSLQQLLMLLGLFVGVVVLLIWGFVSLLAALLIWLIPPELEAQMGSVLIAAYEERAEEGAVQNKLNELQDRIEAQQDKRQRRDLRVIYLPEPTVNALAIPGDRIVIFRGLLDNVTSENELMMILGHEVGHFVNRDHLRGIAKSLSLQIVLSLLFGNNVGLQSAGSLTAAVSQARLSQNQELAADRMGLDLLVKVYGHGGGATDFFDRLAGERPVDFLGFLATHPHPQERARRLQQIIREEGYRIEPVRPLPPELVKT